MPTAPPPIHRPRNQKNATAGKPPASLRVLEPTCTTNPDAQPRRILKYEYIQQIPNPDALRIVFVSSVHSNLRAPGRRRRLRFHPARKLSISTLSRLAVVASPTFAVFPLNLFPRRAVPQLKRNRTAKRHCHRRPPRAPPLAPLGTLSLRLSRRPRQPSIPEEASAIFRELAEKRLRRPPALSAPSAQSPKKTIRPPIKEVAVRRRAELGRCDGRRVLACIHAESASWRRSVVLPSRDEIPGRRRTCVERADGFGRSLRSRPAMRAGRESAGGAAQTSFGQPRRSALSFFGMEC